MKKNLFRGLALAALASVSVMAMAVQTFTIPNGTNSMDEEGDTDNVIITAMATGATYNFGRQIQIDSATLTEIDLITYGYEATVKVTSSAHPGDAAYFTVFGDANFTGSLTATPGTLRNVSGSLVNKTVTAGDTLTFEFFESYDDEVNAADAVWDNLVFTTMVYVPPTPPGTFIDLGTLTTAGVHRTDAHAAGEVKWYKFVTTGPTNATDYVNIDTELSDGYGDTEIGLYDNNGNLIADDDDSGTGLFSLLSFGAGGVDGDIPAGTYWLGVSGFNAIWNPLWDVTTTSTRVGDVNVNINTNIGGGGGGGRLVSGTVNLQDLSVSPNGWQVHWELLDGFDFSVVESGNATLDASGNYTANLTTNSGSGYVFAVKGVHWLRGGVESIDLTTDLTGINFSLKNGDVDGDNEVGPGDFGALSSAFGSVDGDANWNLNADLDGDGEVGPSDFGILSANFGEAGY